MECFASVDGIKAFHTMMKPSTCWALAIFRMRNIFGGRIKYDTKKDTHTNKRFRDSWCGYTSHKSMGKP